MKFALEILDVTHRQIDDRQVAQTEKSNFTRPTCLDVVLVELADRVGVFALRLIQRTEVGNLARRDQHATGVHADVARHAFELFRQDPQFLDFFVRFQPLFQDAAPFPCASGEGCLPGAVGISLEIPSTKAVTRSSTRPTSRTTVLCRHGTESDNLRYRIPHRNGYAHIRSRASGVLAEVDVEVGHRHPLQIEENARTAARRPSGSISVMPSRKPPANRHPSRARPHRATVMLGPVIDEVGNDQVTRGSHRDNGVGFDLQPGIVLRATLVARRLIREQLQQPFFRPCLARSTRKSFNDMHIRCREQWQEVLAQLPGQIAALGNRPSCSAIGDVGERNIAPRLRQNAVPSVRILPYGVCQPA